MEEVSSSVAACFGAEDGGLIKSFNALSYSEKVLRPKRMYWKRGVYLNWSSEAYCLVEASSEKQSPSCFVRITVPCSRKGGKRFHISENDTFLFVCVF